MSPALAHSLVGKQLLAKSNSPTNQTLEPRCASKMIQRCRHGFASLRCAAEASRLLPAFDPTLTATPTPTTTRSFTSTPPTFYSSFSKKQSTSTPSPTRTAATKAAGNDPALEAKARALDQALKEINTRFGKNSIMKLGATDFGDVQTSPSGALTLDLALGGGYPKGRVVEIYGPESSGKSTLALHAMAEVQKQGGQVALIDAEHAFDPQFAKRLGLDVDNLFLCQPDSGEMALEVADQLIRSSAVDMIAVDSVAALVPRSEIEGEIGQLQVGAQARLMSAALRKLSGNASRHNCTVIFLNQLRQKVGVIYGNPEITSGGQALKYYASVRVEVRVKEKLGVATTADGHSGIRVKSKIVKNKVAPPYKLAEFDILFGSGISANGCLLDAAEATGIVSRRGSFYYFEDKNIGQGKEKTLEKLKEDETLRARVEEQTRHVLAGKDINDLYDDDAVASSSSGGSSGTDEEEETTDVKTEVAA